LIGRKLRDMLGFFRQKINWLLLSLIICSALLLSARLLFPDYHHRFLDYNDLKHGIVTQRFNNVKCEGNPVLETLIPEMNLQRPDEPLLKGDNFGLIMSGHFYASVSGIYIFKLVIDDGAVLSIDDQTVISNLEYHDKKPFINSLNLAKGWHKLAVRYFNGQSAASFKLCWQPPGSAMSVMDQNDIFPTVVPGSVLLFFRFLSLLHQWLTILVFILAIALSAGCKLIKKEASGETGKCFSKYVPGIVLGTLLFSLFWSTYYLPNRNIIAHGLNSRFVTKDSKSARETGLLASNVRFNSRTDEEFRFGNKKVEFSGWLKIDKSGDYIFSFQADDKAELFVDQSLLLTSSVRENPRIPVREKLFLHTGYHRILITFENQSMPAFIDLQWLQPRASFFSPIPIELLFGTIPTQEEKSIDATFLLKIQFTKIILIGFIVLQLLWLISQKNKMLSVLTLRIGIALFSVLFLIQSPALQRVHQAGLLWYISASIHVRFMVCMVIFLLLSGLTDSWMHRFRCWIKKRNSTILIMGFLAVLSAVFAQVSFTGLEKPLPLAGAGLYAMSALFILFSGIKPISGRQCLSLPDKNFLENQVFYIFGLIVILMSIFMRFYKLNIMPPGLWWDEAQTGRVVQSILEGNFPPIYDIRINAGSIASYLNALWCLIIHSTSPYALRSYTAFTGVITVIASYWFYRQFFNRWWSLSGMALTAGSRWLFTINRTAMATIDETILLTFLTLTMYSKASRQSAYRYYFATGALLGLAMHLHTGARVLPLIIGMDILFRSRSVLAGNSQEFLGYLKRASLLVVTALIVFAPMGLYIYNHSDEYMKRSVETLLTTEFPGCYLGDPYIQNVRYYLQTYVFSGDWHPRHNYDRLPQLPPLVAVFAVLGAFLALGRILRRPEHRLMISGFCLISLQGILTIHFDSANLNRIAENIPIIMLWAVYGMELLVRGLRQIIPGRAGRYLAFGSVVIAISVFWIQEYKDYFHYYLPWKDLAGVYGFQPEITEMAALARDIIENEPDTQVWAMYTTGDPFMYIFSGDTRLHNLSVANCPAMKDESTMVFLIPAHLKPVIDHVAETFPDAQISDIPYSLNNSLILLKEFRVSPAVF